MADTLSHLNSKTFSEQLHTKFNLYADSANALEMELIEVNDRTASPKVELFSIFFRGPQKPLLPQRIYRLEHGKLGSFEIFLTNVEADEQSATYEAVFHRVHKNQPGEKKQ
ncbi:MAG TPA: hypothetical protein VKZ53_04015 [Candidatus Angelobacter sp.]|nr:hypothetical protein [Candidatus Angelobacter sp.]